MGTLSTDGKNTGTNAIRATATHVALFNLAGTELTGGSPVYARLPITWGAASGGSSALTGTPYALNVPASSNVKTIRYMTLLSGGVEVGRETLTTEETYVSQGVFEVTAGSLAITD